MILGIGTDIIEVGRIKSSIEKIGERFLLRIFTDTEIKYCEEYNESKYQHYAARFAAKEAFSKAIGTGIAKGFQINETGIINNENGKPEFDLYGGMKEKWGDHRIHLSLSHTKEQAIAYVIVEETID